MLKIIKCCNSVGDRQREKRETEKERKWRGRGIKKREIEERSKKRQRGEQKRERRENKEGKEGRKSGERPEWKQTTEFNSD